MSIDSATLAKVHDLLVKMGTNADASGTSTLFARLAQIAGYVDQVEGFTDTVETVLGANATKIGTNSDAAGTATLFARLAQVASYANNAETHAFTNRNSIGASTDGTAAATLFGKIAAVDAKAAAAGAPAKSLCTNIISTPVANPSISLNTSFQNILNITGKGYLSFLHFYMSNNFKNNTIQVIIDGTTVLDVTVYTENPTNIILVDRSTMFSGTTTYAFATGQGYSQQSVYLGTPITIPYVNASAISVSTINQWWPDAIWFRSSLVVRAKTTTGTDNLSYAYTGGYY